jgi:hypothetical protein
MYEPKRPPRLTKKTIALPGMRYGISSGATYVDLLDPTIDPLHIHEYLEIFYNLGDEVSFLVNGTVYPVRAGEILVNRAGDVHVCIFPETKAYRYGCLWIDADFSSPVFSFLKEKDFSPLFSFSEEKEKAVFGLLSELEKIEKSIKGKLKVILGLDAKIKLESPNTLARFEGKAKRVKDLRKKL